MRGLQLAQHKNNLACRARDEVRTTAVLLVDPPTGAAVVLHRATSGAR